MQQIINKILSFDKKELKEWMCSRLHGIDEYFSIYEGYETNLSEFLKEAYYHIGNKQFRKQFLNNIYSFTKQLKNLDIKNKTEQEYVYELLSLIGNMKDFKKKRKLLKIAKNRLFKNSIVYDINLHCLLLNTLASWNVYGSVQFWLSQLDENTNLITNITFYALLGKKKHKIFFKYFGIFLKRMEDIDIELMIDAIIEDIGKEKFSKYFEKYIKCEYKGKLKMMNTLKLYI
jgi:hypothetical protein